MLKLLAVVALGLVTPAAAAPLTRAAVHADAARAFNRVDRNRDGLLTVAELRLAAARPDSPIARLPRGQREALATFWFAKVDADHNGRLTRAEARSFAGRVFASADRNHDGRVSEAERRAAEAAARGRRPLR